MEINTNFILGMLGTGVFTTIVNQLFNRNLQKSTSRKTDAETESTNIKTYQDLLEEYKKRELNIHEEVKRMQLELAQLRDNNMTQLQNALNLMSENTKLREKVDEVKRENLDLLRKFAELERETKK